MFVEVGVGMCIGVELGVGLCIEGGEVGSGVCPLPSGFRSPQEPLTNQGSDERNLTSSLTSPAPVSIVHSCGQQASMGFCPTPRPAQHDG